MSFLSPEPVEVNSCLQLAMAEKGKAIGYWGLQVTLITGQI
jgi:hypothetical protein